MRFRFATYDMQLSVVGGALTHAVYGLSSSLLTAGTGDDQGPISADSVNSPVDADYPPGGVPKTRKDLRTATRSDIPTLLVSGSFDAVTPPSTGVTATRTLPNSTRLSFAGVGHAVNQFNRCAQEVFASFLSDPGAPDTACVAELTPPPIQHGRMTWRPAAISTGCLKGAISNTLAVWAPGDWRAIQPTRGRRGRV